MTVVLSVATPPALMQQPYHGTRGTTHSDRKHLLGTKGSGLVVVSHIYSCNLACKGVSYFEVHSIKARRYTTSRGDTLRRSLTRVPPSPHQGTRQPSGEYFYCF